MRKTLLLLFAWAAGAVTAFAQVCAGYQLDMQQGTYEEITDGTPVTQKVVAGSDFTKQLFDDELNGKSEPAASLGLPIGFDFRFNNALMKRFVIGAGHIRLGSDSVRVTNADNSLHSIDYALEEPNVIAMTVNKDFYGTEATKVTYKVLGEEGKRVLVVQWKDLSAMQGFWGDDVVTGDMQMRLYEETGNISVIYNGWAPESTEDSYNIFSRLLIHGSDDDKVMFSGSWAEPTLTIKEATITLSQTEYPADGTIYTFEAPGDCAAPATIPTDLQLTSTSTAISGSFVKTADADHYLVLLSEKAALGTLPENGKSYAAGDMIGDAHVVAYTTEETFATADTLQGASDYYITVVAANSMCMYGPAYNTAEMLAKSITTLAMAPQALEAEAVNKNTIRISLKANAKGEKIVVASTTMPYYDQYDQMRPWGDFGDLPETIKEGETTSTGAVILYVGDDSKVLEMKEQELNTVYFYRAWTIDDNGVCSSTYLDDAVSTGSDEPYAPDFTNTPNYEAPIGWDSNGDFTLYSDSRDGAKFLQCIVKEGNTTEGVTNSIATPWIQLSEGTNRLKTDVNITVSGGFGGIRAPFTEWEKGDSLIFQVSEDGTNYTDFAVFDAKNPIEFEDAEDVETLRLPFDNCAGKQVKLRVLWKTFSAPKLQVSNLVVEGVEDCDYPIDIMADDSLSIGGTLVLDWDRQGNENKWQLRYRKMDEETWSDVIDVDTKPYTLSGLDGQTDYLIEMRAVCDAEHQSKWSETAQCTTGYALPVDVTFTSLSALDAGWEFATGKLATPTELDMEASTNWSWSLNFRKQGQLAFKPTAAGDQWLLSPKFELDDDHSNFEVKFTLLTTKVAADTTDAKYLVLMSKDGITFNEADVIDTLTNEELPARAKQIEYSVIFKGHKGITRFALYSTSTNSAPAQIQVLTFGVNRSCENDITDIVTSDTTNVSVNVAWDNADDTTLVFIRKAGDESRPFVKTDKKEMFFDNLEPRTDYEIGLTKTCEEGDTAKVIIVPVTTLAHGKCAPVTDVKVTPQKYAALVEWTAEASAYNVRYGRTDGEGGKTTIQVTDTCALIGNLQQNTEYEYSIQAMCSTIEGDTSEWTTPATFRTLEETCFAPTDIKAVAAWDSVVVTWTGEAESYRIAYAPTATMEWTEVLVGKVNETAIKGLTPKTDYTLKMMSYCSASDSSLWSEPILFSTIDIPECVTPTELTVAGISSNSAIVSWTADASNLRWNLHYRKGTDAAWTEVNGLTQTSYELQNLDPDANYIWSVMAECEAQNSKWASQNKFSTVTTAIATLPLGEMKVFVNQQVLNVVNVDKGRINAIRIYNEAGALIKSFDTPTNENIFIPLYGTSGSVLIVKIQGADKQQVYKLGVK